MPAFAKATAGRPRLTGRFPGQARQLADGNVAGGLV